MPGMEKMLYDFEEEEWGTHDLTEITSKIEAEEWNKARHRMTGMNEEQADWEEGLHDDED